jgi:DNA-binding transcriptional LysR family regulator
MSLTPIGQRLLKDAQTMLAHTEEATQRLREDQTTLSGHLRLFGTMDLGQSIVTRGTRLNFGHIKTTFV